MTTGEQPRRVVLRGGPESRVALGLVGVVFVVAAVAGMLDPGQGGLAGQLLLVGPLAIGAGLVLLCLRARVVVTDDEVLVQHFADPRTRCIPRDGVVGVEVSDVSSLVMTAVAPRLVVSAESGQSREYTDNLLSPLTTWTWWRSGTPARFDRLMAELRTALDLPV